MCYSENELELILGRLLAGIGIGMAS